MGYVWVKYVFLMGFVPIWVGLVDTNQVTKTDKDGQTISIVPACYAICPLGCIRSP